MSGQLGKHGQAIWDTYKGETLDAGSQALIRELARLTDALDELDDLASGRKERWAVAIPNDLGEVTLVVDKILDQRRNHALALKAIYAEARSAGLRPVAASGGISKDEEPEDALAKRRREREDRERKLGG